MKKILQFALLLVACAGLFQNSVSAQDGRPNQKEIADLAVLHTDAMNVNREKLKALTSDYRIEVSENGQLQWIDMVNVQVVGADQRPVLTQVNRDQIVEQERGLFSKRGQRKDFEEMDKIIQYVFQWTTYYNRLPADRVLTLFNQAVQTGHYQFAPYSNDVIGVWGSNIRNSDTGDLVTLWFNATNGHPARLAFTVPVLTGKDGETLEAIEAVINYRYLQDGSAFYPDHIEVTLPARQMKIKVEHLASLKKL